MEQNKGGLRKKALKDDVLGVYGKLAVLLETKKKSEDRLRPLIRYTIEIACIKPVRLCFAYVFCQYSFATILTIYHLLATFDTKELLKHGSFCGIQIFVLFNLGSLVLLVELFTKLFKKYGVAVLPIEMLEGKTLKNILLVIKIFKLLSIFDMALAIIAAIGFIAAPEYFDEKTYLCVWIQQTFPDHSKILLQVVHWSSMPVALALAGSSIGWSYGSLTAIVQILILHEMISSISKSALPHELRRDSRLYQECVKQKMIMSIMTHQYTARFQAMISEFVEIPMMLLASGSLILGGSLMLEFFGNQDREFTGSFQVYIGILSFTVAGVIAALSYLIIGQILKDESARCNYKLCMLPWYDMDKDNKRIYSIFLERSKKNLGISNSLMQIDYDLLVRICKSLYSLATVMSRFASSEEV